MIEACQFGVPVLFDSLTPPTAPKISITLAVELLLLTHVAEAASKLLKKSPAKMAARKKWPAGRRG